MFVRDEVPIEVGFEEARGRLAGLGGWFLRASDDVYSEGIAGQARTGPLGPAPGMAAALAHPPATTP